MSYKYTLKFNSTSLAGYAEKDGVTPTAKPIYGRSWKDIGGGQHDTLMGTSFDVKVKLNPMSYTDAITLYTLLTSGTHELEFTWPGTAATIKRQMHYEGITLATTFVAALAAGTTITFKEG